MEGEEFDRLVESIREHGYDPDLPIVVDTDGRIIDGRNRDRACEVAQVQPTYRVYHGDDPYSEAVKLNIDRRHLNATQIAAIVKRSDALRRAADEAKERQRESGGGTGRRGGDTRTVSAAVHEPFSKGRSLEAVGKEYGVSARTLAQVGRVEREAPELLPKLISGEMSASGAERQILQKRAPASPPIAIERPMRPYRPLGTPNLDPVRVLSETSFALDGLTAGIRVIAERPLNDEGRRWLAIATKSLRNLSLRLGDMRRKEGHEPDPETQGDKDE
jgi:hypothetical protein